MWLITTDKGQYINWYTAIKQDQILPGSLVEAFITKSGNHQWFNIKLDYSQISATTFDNDIPF